MKWIRGSPGSLVVSVAHLRPIATTRREKNLPFSPSDCAYRVVLLRRFLFSLVSGTTALPNGWSILDDDQDDRPEEALDDEDSHLRANARFVQGAPAFVQGETGADVAVEGGDAFRPFVQPNVEETLFEVHRRENNGEDPADERSDRVQRTRPAARRRIVASEHCGRVDHRVDDVDDAVDDDDGADASAKPI